MAACRWINGNQWTQFSTHSSSSGHQKSHIKSSSSYHRENTVQTPTEDILQRLLHDRPKRKAKPCDLRHHTHIQLRSQPGVRFHLADTIPSFRRHFVLQKQQNSAPHFHFPRQPINVHEHLDDGQIQFVEIKVNRVHQANQFVGQRSCVVEFVNEWFTRLQNSLDRSANDDLLLALFVQANVELQLLLIDNGDYLMERNTICVWYLPIW